MSEYIEKEALRQFPIRKDHYDKENGDEHFIFGIEAVLEYAENLPAADVAPVRHGRWGVEVGMNFFKERNCPVCKKRIESNFWNFCPNCGAKMDGGIDNG